MMQVKHFMIRAKIGLLITLSLVLCSFYAFCDPQGNLDLKVKGESITISLDRLGIVAKDIKLNVKQNGKLVTLSKWLINGSNDQITIITNDPIKTKWTFKVTAGKLDVESSAVGSVITGTAPATRERIPARIGKQDNGVMYTSFGLVSAENIYNLFDRKTDIMIRFPEGSRLRRDSSDADLMKLIIPIVKGPELSIINDYYIKEVGLQKYTPNAKRFKAAACGWSSWYCYYMGTTEKDMVTETDVLADTLEPYGLEYIQLDACFTRGKEANWLEWTKKAWPKGGKWLCKYITSRGLKPALWINIYGANYEHPAFGHNFPNGRYPENFYLRDKNGKLSGCCCSADKTVVRLDFTNPEVVEKHLKPLFRTLVNEWGLEYLKDAGWGTWMNYYEANKKRAYNGSLDSRTAYRIAQLAVRETMKDKYILGCAMHEIGVGFGVYDGSRSGGDDYASWGGMQVYFDSMFGCNFLNDIIWYSNPDTTMVRSPLTIDEGRTIVSSIALTGQHYFVSDFMARLPEERMDLYRKTIPPVDITPIDLFPFRTKPKCCPRPNGRPNALDLKVNSKAGVYDVVAVYNWANREAVKSLAFGKDLGLVTSKKYLVYDYWKKELLGVFKGAISVNVPSHGVRALILKAVAARPQLLATSRHITGTVSIKDLSWDAKKFTMNGKSKGVAGAPYNLYIHVPEGIKIAAVREEAVEISYKRLQNQLVSVSFKGKKVPVSWSIQFKPFKKSNLPRYTASDYFPVFKKVPETIDPNKPFSSTVEVKNKGGLSSSDQLELYIDGNLRTSEILNISPHGEKLFQFKIPALYKAGSHTLELRIKGKQMAEETVKVKSKPALFEYGDFSLPTIASIGEPVKITSPVKNIGSNKGSETIPLYVDKKISDKRTITLAPGETKNVTFVYKAQNNGKKRVSVGTSNSKVLVVAEEIKFSCTEHHSVKSKFKQSAKELIIEAGGEDMWANVDEYGALSLENKVSGDFIAKVKIKSQKNTNGWAKAGLMVRNDISKPAESKGYLIMGVTPKNGFALQWDSDRNGMLDAFASAGKTSYPAWLMIEKRGKSFTGYYSKDGSTWKKVKTIKLPDTKDAQDVSIFVTAHNPKVLCKVVFEQFKVFKSGK